MALRRARHGERPARAEPSSLVIQPPHLVGMREQPGLLVDDDRVVVPRVPVAEHDLHELVGAVVACVVLQMLVMPHVERFAVIHRGDDVPCRAAARHQVERGEHTGHVERFEIGGRTGGAEAETFRRHAHHREHGDRVHLHAAYAMLDRVAMVVAVAVRHREPIVEEAEVELAFLQHAADGAVVVGRHGVVARFRMAPGTYQVGAVLRLQEADHDHLAHARAPSPLLRSSPVSSRGTAVEGETRCSALVTTPNGKAPVELREVAGAAAAA